MKVNLLECKCIYQ